MGYHTEFGGEFTIDPRLTNEQVQYLHRFRHTCRMRRDERLAAQLPDPERIAVGLPVGHEGAYFVGGTGPFGQDSDESVVDQNTPPGTPDVPGRCSGSEWQSAYATFCEERSRRIANKIAQPGLWCQWAPSEDGSELAWDEGEKFYGYVEWLEYLVHHFFEPWGRKLSGEVWWRGEQDDDRGVIYVRDNEVDAVWDEIHNPGPSWSRPEEVLQ